MNRKAAAIEEESARQAIRNLGPFVTREDCYRVVCAQRCYDEATREVESWLSNGQSVPGTICHQTNAQ